MLKINSIKKDNKKTTLTKNNKLSKNNKMEIDNDNETLQNDETETDISKSDLEVINKNENEDIKQVETENNLKNVNIEIEKSFEEDEMEVEVGTTQKNDEMIIAEQNDIEEATVPEPPRRRSRVEVVITTHLPPFMIRKMNSTENTVYGF